MISKNWGQNIEKYRKRASQDLNLGVVLSDSLLIINYVQKPGGPAADSSVLSAHIYSDYNQKEANVNSKQ